LTDEPANVFAAWSTIRSVSSQPTLYVLPGDGASWVTWLVCVCPSTTRPSPVPISQWQTLPSKLPVHKLFPLSSAARAVTDLLCPWTTLIGLELPSTK